MLLGGGGGGGGDNQATADGSQSGAGVTLRNNNAQMSPNAARKNTVAAGEQRQSTGMLGKLRQLTTNIAAFKTDAPAKGEAKDDLECRTKRRSSSHLTRPEEAGQEPLLRSEPSTSKQQTVSASDVPQESVDIPLTNPASVAVLRDQILSPTTSWTTDLLVTSV